MKHSSTYWTSSNPIINRGAFGFETDTDLIKIGDGITEWTSLPYLNGSSNLYNTYKALLTQTGTNAPVATITQNELGDIVWTYGGSAGYYIATLVGAFPLERTDYIIGQKTNTTIPAIQVQEINSDSFGLFVSSDYANLFITGDNDALNYTSIEIRVRK